MRIIGLDFGDKTIGVAVSDELGWTAQALEVIQRKSGSLDEDIKRISELVEQYAAGEIVVGLPKNMNGEIGPRGEICIEFAERLKLTLNKPVQLWDERLTTISAQRTLLQADVSRKKRKKVVDKMAAGLILQGYLDRHKNR